jgi:hypothetical protein
LAGAEGAENVSEETAGAPIRVALRTEAVRTARPSLTRR